MDNHFVCLTQPIEVALEASSSADVVPIVAIIVGSGAGGREYRDVNHLWEIGWDETVNIPPPAFPSFGVKTGTEAMTSVFPTIVITLPHGQKAVGLRIRLALRPKTAEIQSGRIHWLIVPLPSNIGVSLLARIGTSCRDRSDHLSF